MLGILNTVKSSSRTSSTKFAPCFPCVCETGLVRAYAFSALQRSLLSDLLISQVFFSPDGFQNRLTEVDFRYLGNLWLRYLQLQVFQHLFQQPQVQRLMFGFLLQCLLHHQPGETLEELSGINILFLYRFSIS